MQKIAPLTSPEETRHLLRTIIPWILTAIKVFGSINLRLKLIILPERIYRWLSAVIPSINYHGALKVRLEDTGSWFINGARFARWKSTADDFVWICGTRMHSHHMRIIIDTELLWQLVPER